MVCIFFLGLLVQKLEIFKKNVPKSSKTYQKYGRSFFLVVNFFAAPTLSKQRQKSFSSSKQRHLQLQTKGQSLRSVPVLPSVWGIQEKWIEDCVRRFFVRSKNLRSQSSNVIFVICSIVYTDGTAQSIMVLPGCFIFKTVRSVYAVETEAVNLQ